MDGCVFKLAGYLAIFSAVSGRISGESSNPVPYPDVQVYGTKYK
jgi:hypothetical protein